MDFQYFHHNFVGDEYVYDAMKIELKLIISIYVGHLYILQFLYLFFLWKYYLYSKGHLRKMDPNNTAAFLYCFLLEKDSLLFDVVIKAIVDPFSM